MNKQDISFRLKLPKNCIFSMKYFHDYLYDNKLYESHIPVFIYEPSDDYFSTIDYDNEIGSFSGMCAWHDIEFNEYSYTINVNCRSINELQHIHMANIGMTKPDNFVIIPRLILNADNTIHSLDAFDIVHKYGEKFIEARKIPSTNIDDNKIIDALISIVYYGELYDEIHSWIKYGDDAIAKGSNIIPCGHIHMLDPQNESMEYGELKVFWMLLAKLFGNCHTSPRFQWVNADHWDECKEFIKLLCNEIKEE